MKPVLALLRVSHGLRVVGGSEVRVKDLLHGLPLVAQCPGFRENVGDHRAIRHKVLFLDQGAVTGNQGRIRPGELLDQIHGIEHSPKRSAVGLIGERVAEVPVEVFDVDHVRLPKADDRVSGGVRRHHRNEVNRLAVHVDGDRGFARLVGVVLVGDGWRTAVSTPGPVPLARPGGRIISFRRLSCA